MAQVKGFALAVFKCRPVKEELRVSWARPVTTGVAQFSLLEEPPGRTLALLLQGICRPDRLSKGRYPRLFLRQPTIKAIRKRRICQNIPGHRSGHRSRSPSICVCAAVAPERHSNPRDPARNTASVRVLTASFEKMRLTCDFTVSGEISRIRAMRLLAKP